MKKEERKKPYVADIASRGFWENNREQNQDVCGDWGRGSVVSVEDRVHSFCITILIKLQKSRANPPPQGPKTHEGFYVILLSFHLFPFLSPFFSSAFFFFALEKINIFSLLCTHTHIQREREREEEEEATCEQVWSTSFSSWHISSTTNY